MERKLKRHVAACHYALVTREEDHLFADVLIGRKRVRHLRLGVDKTMFGSHRKDRGGIERKYGIPAGRDHYFVRRPRRCRQKHLYADRGDGKTDQRRYAPSPRRGGCRACDGRCACGVLGNNASLPGFVKPDELARLYASVDVLALPSEVEIRSMAGVEAMASGCAVLVSEKSGVAELFGNTPAMEVVAGGADQWAEALRRFA